MKIRLLLIIIFLSLCFFFGFKKIANNKFETINSDFEDSKILNYLPKDNNLLFISNTETSNILNHIKREFNKEDLDKFILMKDSVLSYLGIDLGHNKLEDIYDNELAISSYGKSNKLKDEILIVFKIKPEKNLNDLLNLANDIDQLEKIIPIYRENKLNYLKFIYRTKDNYIITSPNKKLILDSIKSFDNSTEILTNYYCEVKENFKENNNIFFRKESENTSLFSKSVSPNKDNDIFITTLKLKDKELILKSYLVNNQKNIHISSYSNLTNKNTIKNNDQVSIFSDLKSASDYINPLNDFEKKFLEYLDENLKENVLLISSDKDWIIAFENNYQKSSYINDIEELKSFNKYSLEKNDKVYSIYSKDILEIEDDTIRQNSYKDIFSVESEKLSVVSNNLEKVENIDLILEEFINLKNNINTKDFLYKRLYIKNFNYNKGQYLGFFDDFDFLLQNIINNEEFLEVIKQSIPESNPLLYRERHFKLIS